jgi:hypothetical protein
MSDELNPGRAAFPPFIPESPTRFAQPADPTPTRLQRFLNWLNIRDLPRTVVQDWNQDDGVYHMRNPNYIGPLYVVNLSHISNFVPKNHQNVGFADLVIQLNDLDKKRAVVKIPATWLPVDISPYVHLLCTNLSFQRLLNLGLLAFVSPNRADLILNSDEGRAELERVERVTDSATFKRYWPKSAQMWNWEENEYVT